MLTLLQSGITGGRSLGKGSSEIESGNILSYLMLQFFKNWEGNLALGLGEIQILAKSVLSSCITCPHNKAGLPHLAVDEGALIYLPSGKFAAWKS